ncbi:MAG TPA: hypothetical protein VMJ32_10725 [Pirellulales bacterium]|nr:hypothetical protein [Pirellulales bacterium]
MTDKEMLTEEVKGAGRFLGHSASVIAGLLLLLAALAMGVSLVLLPVGLFVGLVGFLLIVWGLSAKPRTEIDHKSGD